MKRRGSRVTFSHLQIVYHCTHLSQGQPSDCCSNNTPHTAGDTCFSSLPHSNTKSCLDSIPIMTEQDRSRCSSNSACTEDSTCVVYASPDPLLRIGVNRDEVLRTVLWNGPPLEIWQQGSSVSSTVAYIHSWSMQSRWGSFAHGRLCIRCGYQSGSQVICRACGPHSHSQRIINCSTQISEGDNALLVCDESLPTLLPRRGTGIASYGRPPTHRARENARS